MCGYRKREKDDVFTITAGDCCFLFTSLHLHLKIFLFLEKRFLVVFATCSTTSQPETDPPKQTQKKRGRSRHILLSVVSRSPGKLFKRTLTYCGKRTQRYVKREREKKKKAHFLLRLTRVVVRTRGEKVARRRKEFSEQTTSA